MKVTDLQKFEEIRDRYIERLKASLKRYDVDDVKDLTLEESYPLCGFKGFLIDMDAHIKEMENKIEELKAML